MKKILIALLAVVALLAFTVSAFAMHGVKDMFEYTPQIVKSSKADITLSGAIRIRGELNNNVDDFRDYDDDVAGTDDDYAEYDQRVRLGIKATVSPNTMGMVELESTDMDWGQGTGSVGIYGGVGDANSPGVLEIRQAYIAYQSTSLLGSLSGFKAGHMLLGLGNGLFYDHTGNGDDGIVLWTQPSDNTEISLILIKLKETFNGTEIGSADDADAYVLAGETAMNGINISGDVTLLKDNSGTVLVVGSDKGVTLWNIGLRGDADVSGINVSADVEFQTGTVEAFKANGDDMDLGGWAIELTAGTKVGDASVHAGFAYGSGDDIDTEDKYDGFINSISAGQNFTYLYDQKARTAGQTVFSTGTTVSSTYTATKDTGLNNTWYLNAGASANVNPDTMVSVDLFYLQASEEVSNATDMDNKDIGVELDGKVTYQIDTNLVYFAEAGYLWAGDFYANVTGDIDEIDNPYSVRHGIELQF